MANLEFSVPYNTDPGTLREIFRLKRLGENEIREIYLSGPQEYSGAGRVMPKSDMGQFIEIVDRINKEGIRVNLILNSTCEGGNWYSPDVLRSTIEYLRQMYEEHGVEAVTIANPIYIQEIRQRFPDIEICASVLGDIDCLQKAVIYSAAGANVITPDVNINRDLKLLKQIKEATKAELKLMVNEGCLYRCPFRKFHFNYVSHQSKELSVKHEDYVAGNHRFLLNCLGISIWDNSQILRSCWIRPEDTGKYSEITNFFKIVGRDIPRNAIINTIKAYLKEAWDGDLFDILYSSLKNFSIGCEAHLDNKSLDKYKFFEKVTSCDNNCSQCGYCQELARKLIRFGIPKEEVNQIWSAYMSKTGRKI